jgi:flagellar FliL protein
MAAEAEEQEPKKKLPIVKILMMAVGAIVLVGAGAGGAILFQKLTKPADDNPLAIVIERKADGDAAKNEHDAAPAADSHGAPAAGGHGAPAAEGHGAPAGGHGAAAPAGPTGKPVPSKETYVTSYFEFPGNFTTNLRGSRRFAQMSVALATQYDKKVIENVQKHEVAVRAEVLALLAEQSEADVIGVENRKKLQGQIKDAINKLLTERTSFGGVEDVFITALVLQ